MSDAPAPLSAEALCRRCDPARLGFRTTEELADLAELPGQARAEGAIRFAVGMRHEGYNLYVMGPEGYGRRSMVRRVLEEAARAAPVPPDWCYVFNFRTPHRPRALRLPAGRAEKFRQHMERLIEDLRAGIPAAFETDEYRARAKEIESEFEHRQEQALEAVGRRAREQGIALLRTPAGFGFAPLKGDAVMRPDEFQDLSQAEQERIQQRIAELQEALEAVIHEVPKWRREAQRKLRELNRQVTAAAVNSLIEELEAEYRDLPAVAAYLAEVREDVLDNAAYFQQPKEAERVGPFGLAFAEAAEQPLRRYLVNVLVEHGANHGAPIVYEENPTYDNLLGRIEHIAQMGTLVTDFTLIKAGALHRANGGYLVLDALKVLVQPFAWEALKRTLRAREIRTESLGQALSLVSTVSLAPEPIPLDVKVVLVGPRTLYYLLHAYDPEFAELFKIGADFEEDLPRGDEEEARYARLVATLARRGNLRPLDAGAVARVIEQAARGAGEAAKLSANLEALADLLRESDYWAAAAGRALVEAADVERAVAAQRERAGRLRDRVREAILKGTLLIDTAGARIGQVNGLAVTELGGYAFGIPHRITARVRLGGGKVVDIERESQLGGPIHSKGVLILSGFLSARYAARHPLALSASLVFEQSYGGVEGDSASAAELCALLSALAEVPISQAIAITGSVNQHGDIQAVGGVNEKIEGFFDLCAARGFAPGQGVIVPAANVQNLMLRADVVEAVAAGRFAIWPVKTVDEAATLLTGMPAGERDALGEFPPGTLNRRVEEKLVEFAALAAKAPERAAARKPRRGQES
ncbi:MAG: AAA family ATPase [Burkholderiales bacterium]|nr:AAA family ATPase [Burkholderiales bacterium]